MEKKIITVIKEKPFVMIAIQWACLLMSDTAELSKVPIQLSLSRTVDALGKEHKWRPGLVLKLSTTTSYFQTWKINWFPFPTGIIGSRLQRWMSTHELDGGQLKIYMFKKQRKEKENRHVIFTQWCWLLFILFWGIKCDQTGLLFFFTITKNNPLTHSQAFEWGYEGSAMYIVMGEVTTTVHYI